MGALGLSLVLHELDGCSGEVRGDTGVLARVASHERHALVQPCGAHDATAGLRGQLHRSPAHAGGHTTCVA